ncbi:PEX11 domain protein [Akanthomyces lecanii RCEF 1005]|uniref:PEX11 domain protein n=1 Tax=Akanthomyces lecanii RCEF 1005 TaxID=1081108 RepID=A0A168FDE2_CORDF|nr:PEX11 domain protein [Akanthomyces lecanii RCEF 1005]
MAKSKTKTRTTTESPSSPAPSLLPQTATAPSSPRRSLLQQTCKFLNTTAGLDLSLRLIHGLVIISAQASSHELVATRSVIASWQLNLARRYLRFFVLFDCIQNVLDAAGREYASLAYKTLDLVEWSCLLLYFALENLTMLHDMKIHVVPWYTPVLVEANKFWFYAILASIVRTVVQRAAIFSGTVKPSKSGKKQALQSRPPPPLRRLVVDVLDLTLPASFIGWVALDDVTVGCFMTLSTILVWQDVWAKAQ